MPDQTPCPDASSLKALLENTLPERDANTVAEHLEECAWCRMAIEEQAASSRTWQEVRAALASQPRELSPPLARVVRGLANSRLTDFQLTVPSEYAAILPSCIGPYRVEAEIGRGGMGVVYRAFDEALGRTIAVKQIQSALFRPQTRERFLREARAIARVRQDNVVGVLGVGETADGAPYLAMEYLAGPNLAVLIRAEGPLPPRAAAAIAAAVADGLAAVHGAGLIHRDVKPSNVLFDTTSPGPKELTNDPGRPKLADFGLARDDLGPTSLTAEGAIAGTPAYLSPEQARGDDSVDSRTDVYSLGVTLYEMLTGETPFRGPPHQVVRQIIEDEPPRPRRLNDAIPRDLETIVMKALAKQPERRYRTAAAFAADLRRFLGGEPIEARPAGAIERAWRWRQRNPRAWPGWPVYRRDCSS